VAGPLDEQSIRAAALSWLHDVTLSGAVPISREQLANDFHSMGSDSP